MIFGGAHVRRYARSESCVRFFTFTGSMVAWTPFKKESPMSEKVEVENVNHPGHVTRVDALKYRAARAALLSILPTTGPGLTQAEMLATVVPVIDQHLFPGGSKSGWWIKTVQLDLEAKGVIFRVLGKPLRWTTQLMW